MSNDYRAAYERQKKARELAESLLENKSRELYESNQALKIAFDELNQHKEQLIHQEKLASIGQLAAGVAHEINNPTGFISSNLQTLDDYKTVLKTAIDHYQSFIQTLPTQNEHVTHLNEQLKKLDYY